MPCASRRASRLGVTARVALCIRSCDRGCVPDTVMAGDGKPRRSPSLRGSASAALSEREVAARCGWGSYGQGANRVIQISTPSTNRSTPPENAATAGSNDGRQTAAARAKTSTHAITAAHARTSAGAVAAMTKASANPPRPASPTEQPTKACTRASARRSICNPVRLKRVCVLVHQRASSSYWHPSGLQARRSRSRGARTHPARAHAAGRRSHIPPPASTSNAPRTS